MNTKQRDFLYKWTSLRQVLRRFYIWKFQVVDILHSLQRAVTHTLLGAVQDTLTNTRLYKL